MSGINPHGICGSLFCYQGSVWRQDEQATGSDCLQEEKRIPEVNDIQKLNKNSVVWYSSAPAGSNCRSRFYKRSCNKVALKYVSRKFEMTCIRGKETLTSWSSSCNVRRKPQGTIKLKSGARFMTVFYVIFSGSFVAKCSLLISFAGS